MMCQSINQSYIDLKENKVVSNVPRALEKHRKRKENKKLKSVTFTIDERRKPIGESTYQHT